MKENKIKYLENNNILGRYQFEFGIWRSCLASLLGYHKKNQEFVEQGGKIDSLFLNFEKAFD